MHYYQFNIGDYASHASHLTELEDLGYRRLLDLYYLSESPLEDDVSALCRKVRMRGYEEEIAIVLSDFFVLDGDKWTHKRADEEIAKYHAKADTARVNGAKGGRPVGSTKKPKITQPVNLANPEITGSKANHKPITINQEPIKENTPYQAVLDAYHLSLPMLPGVKKLTEARKRHIKARWTEFQKSGEGMDGFNALFSQVGRSSFLKEGQFCNLEWMTKEANYVKIMEGNYLNGSAPAQQQVLVR